MRSNPSRLPKQFEPEPTHQRSLAARWFEAWLDWCDAVAQQDPKLLARTKAITSMLNELSRSERVTAGRGAGRVPFADEEGEDPGPARTTRKSST